MTTGEPTWRLVLVRHGATDWSRLGRHTGRTDVPLSPEGRIQAELLRGPLATHRSERGLSSPLRRALETCRLAGLGERVQVRPELEEWDYGDYEGLTLAQVHERQPDWRLWTDGCPGGECPSDVAGRCEGIIDELRRGAENAVIFAHGHLLRMLATCWLGLPPDGGRLLALDPASISVLGHEHGNPVLTHWNLEPASQEV